MTETAGMRLFSFQEMEWAKQCFAQPVGVGGSQTVCFLLCQRGLEGPAVLPLGHLGDNIQLIGTELYAATEGQMVSPFIEP
jgi:hypothetical protein